MKTFLLSIFIVSAFGQTTNRQALAKKAFTLGLVSGTVTNEATANNIMTCMETPILKCPPIGNLSDSGKNCVMSKSGNFLVKVMNLLNNMNQCLKGDTFDLLSRALSVGKPIIEPLYSQLCGNITQWKNNGKTAAQQADLMWGWVGNQATTSVINQYCTKMVNGGAVNKTEWGCLKKPGDQVVNFTTYPCYKLVPKA